MTDLNKQYFETRESHDKQVKKNAWITWAIILLLALIWIIRDINKTLQKEERFSEKSIENKIEGFTLTTKDSVYFSQYKEFRILIKNRLYFGSINKEMPIMIIANDTTDLLVFIKRAQTDKKYDSLIKQWESKITQTDSTYRFSNTQKISEKNLRKEIGTVKLAKDGKEMIGEILIVEKGTDIFIVQGIVNSNSWELRKMDIQEMIHSFEIQ